MYFSPSGNTAEYAVEIREALRGACGAQVQMIDMTRSGYFTAEDKSTYLRSVVTPHDILIVGGPVYAHHLQYHVKDMIRMLPEPDGDKWGRTAMSFVTYGGITSGVALEEAGELLRESGRIVAGGLKIPAPHRMTRAFMHHEYRAEVDAGKVRAEIARMSDAVSKARTREPKDCGSALKYQPRMKKLIADVIFNEKTWHEKRYPKVRIKEDACTKCGVCLKVCPVERIGMTGETASMNESASCIHCLNCVTECPSGSVHLEGDIERGRAFMEKIIRKNGGKESPPVFFYD